MNDGFCGFAFGTSTARTIPCLETDAGKNPNENPATGAAASCDGAPPGVALGAALLGGGAFLGDSNLGFTGAAAGCDGAPPGVALSAAFGGVAFLGDINVGLA